MPEATGHLAVLAEAGGYGCAVAGEAAADGRADAARPSGDEGNPVVEPVACGRQRRRESVQLSRGIRVCHRDKAAHGPGGGNWHFCQSAPRVQLDRPGVPALNGAHRLRRGEARCQRTTWRSSSPFRLRTPRHRGGRATVLASFAEGRRLAQLAHLIRVTTEREVDSPVENESRPTRPARQLGQVVGASEKPSRRTTLSGPHRLRPAYLRPRSTNTPSVLYANGRTCPCPSCAATFRATSRPWRIAC